MTQATEMVPAAEVNQDVAKLVLQARELVIDSPAAYEKAADMLKAAKAGQKMVLDHYRPLKQSADKHKQTILASEKRDLGPWQEIEEITKRGLLTWQRAEEVKRQAEQRRLQAEADERARREREALEKRAAAAKKPETQAKYQEAAAQVSAPVVQVAPTQPKVTGLATRKRWRFRVVDAAQIPREYLMVDETKLRRYAEAMKEGANVPGVQFYQEEELAASAR